jgi:hypothetical protein
VVKNVELLAGKHEFLGRPFWQVLPLSRHVASKRGYSKPSTTAASMVVELSSPSSGAMVLALPFQANGTKFPQTPKQLFLEKGKIATGTGEGLREHHC